MGYHTLHGLATLLPSSFQCARPQKMKKNTCSSGINKDQSELSCNTKDTLHLSDQRSSKKHGVRKVLKTLANTSASSSFTACVKAISSALTSIERRRTGQNSTQITLSLRDSSTMIGSTRKLTTCHSFAITRTMESVD